MVALKTEPPPEGENATSYFLLSEPVIVLYGKGEIPAAKSFSRSNSVFRLLRRLGRQRIPVRLVIQGGRVLTPRSLKALNLFIQYGRGLRFVASPMGPTRWGWRDFESQLAMKWRPLTPHG